VIKDNWFCIAGIHQSTDGQLAAAWIGWDKPRDKFHLFDCVLIRRTVPVIIAERLNAGKRRWIPIAWTKKDEAIADKLLLSGCNMEPKPLQDSPAHTEAAARYLWELMESERFKINFGLDQFEKEIDHYTHGADINTFPLIAASMHAIEMREYARRQQTSKKQQNFPKVAII